MPTINVSLVDLTFTSGRDTSVEEINDAISKAAKGDLSGILGISDAPLVSIAFNHNANSSTFDVTQTQVIESRFCRVLSWYDYEWGFSNRMLDTAAALGKLG